MNPLHLMGDSPPFKREKRWHSVSCLCDDCKRADCQTIFYACDPAELFEQVPENTRP
jgi:hypothetical protein